MMMDVIEEAGLVGFTASLRQSMATYYSESSEAFIGNVSLLLPLLDTLKNVVFFVKD